MHIIYTCFCLFQCIKYGEIYTNHLVLLVGTNRNGKSQFSSLRPECSVLRFEVQTVTCEATQVQVSSLLSCIEQSSCSCGKKTSGFSFWWISTNFGRKKNLKRFVFRVVKDLAKPLSFFFSLNVLQTYGSCKESRC